ncbi:hypothetical protein IV203_022497 [Nitzschia inconspicua]|uniref:Uncharacterized protein n=1 Tax=Nitzschia inconspicua TaxID=303405 RepID=A0A9K3PGV4_9STRA|nr:hypothetical protein IV203_022721 [Nitzschia inconspicua]KAG7344489.1 hypothetical protein IV203_022497 [Nitzschia inconspicua]
MNRSAFLSCLSFFKPLGKDMDDTNEDRQQQQQQQQTEASCKSVSLRTALARLKSEGKCHTEPLLMDDCFHVSIEPLGGSKNDEDRLGPAYFSPPVEPTTTGTRQPSRESEKTSMFDPAMCSFRMETYTSVNMPSPSHDKRLTTPRKDEFQQERTLFGGGMMTDVINGRTTSSESIVLCMIEDGWYQLNVHALQDVRLEHCSTTSATRSSPDGNDKTFDLPPCLILQFPSCWFRIFSSSSSSSSSTMPQQQNDQCNEAAAISALIQAKDILNRLRSSSSINDTGDPSSSACPFPVRLSLEGNDMDTSRPSLSVEGNDVSSRRKTANDTLRSHSIAWKDFSVLEQVLSNPLASLPELAEQKRFRSFLLDKLTELPKHVADCMIEEGDLTTLWTRRVSRLGRIMRH